MGGPSGPLPHRNQTYGQSSGSQQPELRYLAIGRIVRAHGVRGEVSVIPLTDFPERFEETEWVYIGDQFEAEAYRLEGVRPHKQHLLCTLATVTSRTEAEQLKGLYVQVPISDAMPLPEGDFYGFQLIDLQVVSSEGETLGVVRTILETGANDVYVVQREQGGEILLPAIPDVIKSIDLEAGQIEVELIEGLI